MEMPNNMKMPNQILEIQTNFIYGRKEIETVKIGGRSYDIKLCGNKYDVTRRMPNSSILRFASATKDFFARGFSTKTRAAAYAKYLNKHYVAPDNPAPASLNYIIPPQSAMPSAPQQLPNSLASGTVASPATPTVTSTSGGDKAVQSEKQSQGAKNVGAAKRLVTYPNENVDTAANRIFDALSTQEGKIGITMSSQGSTYENYINSSLFDYPPNKQDGFQAIVLLKFTQKCKDAKRFDLLARIYIVPFVSDDNTSMEITDENIDYASSFLQDQDSTLFVWGLPDRALAIGGGQFTHAFPSSKNYAKIKAALIPAETAAVVANQFSVQEIDDWLFKGKCDDRFPKSRLRDRMPENFRAKTEFSSVPLCNTGKYTGRFGIYEGGITDLRASGGKTAICTSNNGDLLTGCGYAIAKAVVSAAGPALQAELYNKYGVPEVMTVPKYGKENYAKSEGRGYALTCSAHDMGVSHGLTAIELLAVPLYDINGVKNMYKEAFQHSKDMDYIAVPMAGITHPVLYQNRKLSAKVATDAAKEFMDENPESQLKIVFVIYNDSTASENYRQEIAA